MIKRNNRKGFTIVELVIVIAVIVVLAAVLIPTFASIIKKANESVDMQVVKQMNTILQADELANSKKPATVVDAQNILIANGADDFTPADSQNVFYWVGSENRVILWQKDEGDDVTTGKVTYPKEYAKTYKDVTTPSADWKDLNFVVDETNYIELTVPEGGTLRSTLLNAIEDAEDGAVIKLPANSTLGLEQGGLHWLGEAMKKDGGTGKDITLDLNGSTITSAGSYAAYTKNDAGNWVVDADGDYVMNVLEVPANGELVLTNGSIDIQHGNQPALASIITGSGSSLILRDVDLSTTTAGVMPAGDASEVIIDSCSISALNYALSTNRMESSNIHIVISNSDLSATYATAVMINTPADAHITNSKITGVVHGVILRSGALEIENSTIVVTDTAPGIYSANNFAQGYGFNGFWGTGNTLPAGAIVVGDYTKPNPDGSFSYSGDSILKLSNTKLESAAGDDMPEILLAAYDPDKTVSVTYDESCTVGDIVVYGSVWDAAEGDDTYGLSFAHPGTITVNGEAKTLS